MHNINFLKQSEKLILHDSSFVPSLEHILTKRELEICGLIAKGQNSWQIARHLHISEGTVKNHISSIFDKTGIRNRTELATKYILEYEQAVTDILDLPSTDETLDHGCQASHIATLRLLGNNNLPNIIPLIFREQPFVIGRFDISIGRKQCDFEFERTTKAVSRRHAAIERLSSGFAITDLNSRAGTFLNGERIPPESRCAIKHGDKISFGIAGADYIFEI